VRPPQQQQQQQQQQLLPMAAAMLSSRHRQALPTQQWQQLQLLTPTVLQGPMLRPPHSLPLFWQRLDLQPWRLQSG
jgi:hypothetical protein